MRHRIFSLIITLLFAASASARKDSNTLSGTVKDNHGAPVISANVVVLSTEKKLVKAGFTDDQGNFAIEGIASGSYILQVMLIGFETYTDEKLFLSGNTTLPPIILQEKSNILNEVSVRAQKPFIEVKADKLIVNVENSIVSAGSSALEILQRSPGVTVDNNDNISLKGKQGVMIWIDGKQTPMSGSDLANVLKSMPSNSIDKIEIISNPGARYDAAGNAGIINIKTKKDKRLGANGNLNLSYGQGVYSKYGIGGSINYRKGKLNVYATYNLAKRYWFNHLMLNRKFLDTAVDNKDAQLFRYDQDNYSLFDFTNHIGSAGLDYSLSGKTTIGFSASGGSNKFDPKANNNSRALDAKDQLLYNFNTTGRHQNLYYNYAANAYMRHSFDSSGRELSVDLDYAAFGNQSQQHFLTTYTAFDGVSRPDYYLSSDLQGVTEIRSVKADYVQPLSRGLRLETGAKSSFVTADNEPVFFENNSETPDPARTNHFIYQENINAAYVNATKDWTKYSLQFGVRAENTNIQFKQTAALQQFDTAYAYTQLFPSLAFQYHLNPKHDVGITLSRRIERPNYQQLNPFKYYIDKTTYREGYPRLQPASFYSVELTHTFRQRFVTSFTYGINKGIITEVIQPSDTEDSVTVQTNKNLDKMIFAGISGAYPFTITRWWNNVTSFNIYYARYEGNIANTPLNSGRPTFDLNTNNTFLLPHEFSAELGFIYQARQQYGYMDVQPVWLLNAGIQKNLLNKKATIKLNIQDIFWKGYPRATSTYTGYQEDFIAERETRIASVSFTFRFGSRSAAPGRRHNSGAEEEKRRAGNGGA